MEPERVRLADREPSGGGMRMKKLSYAGVVEPWKVDLIVNRARHMGCKAHDLEDVQQELILDVMDFRFEAGRSNGAKETTVLIALIDNRLRNRLRASNRYRARLNRFGEDVEESYEPIPEAERALDIRTAVASLAERERQVCHALGFGLTQHQIAKRLGCGWHTVGRIVARIRRRFEERGLDGWVRG